MSENNVGAGILSIITESLYDNPIVVFREYVQNSIDSIQKEDDHTNSEIKIWISNNNLFFLDNGKGVDKSIFINEMVKIGASSKKRQKNLGYKGIGRLSGVPYCKKLIFVNICDYLKSEVQSFSISGERYEQIKNDESYLQLNFTELMDKIGVYNENADLNKITCISKEKETYEKVLTETNTGFLVVLNDISNVLNNTINANSFFSNLQWLLPVDFDKDLYSSDRKDLFSELTTNIDDSTIPPVRYCRISYNDIQIYRPINKEMLRDYVCKSNFKYAVGFNTFNGDKIFIDKNNCFSGIRIYIDNMLLCDENELLQNLDHYGLLAHTPNGQLQSVRGIGAMIYITDKINISANARRTFIEVTDNDSLEFLNLLAEFVNTIYDTRYALSNYTSAKAKQEADKQKLKSLKEKALESLRKMAKEDIELPTDFDQQEEYEKMSDSDKKRTIKRAISFQLDQKLKEYLRELKNYDLKTAYDSFFSWLKQK